MNKKYEWITITQFAEKHGISRQTVLQWIRDDRVDCWEPAEGVRLISADTDRPEPLAPWQRKREKFSHLD